MARQPLDRADSNATHLYCSDRRPELRDGSRRASFDPSGCGLPHLDVGSSVQARIRDGRGTGPGRDQLGSIRRLHPPAAGRCGSQPACSSSLNQIRVSRDWRCGFTATTEGTPAGTRDGPGSRGEHLTRDFLMRSARSMNKSPERLVHGGATDHSIDIAGT